MLVIKKKKAAQNLGKSVLLMKNSSKRAIQPCGGVMEVKSLVS